MTTSPTLLYWIIFGGIMLLSWLVQQNLSSKFEKYSQVRLDNGMTGKDVAEKMLRDNGIFDVKVTSTPGSLTDHYDPTKKTVNLSESVYDQCSVAAAAVAAHECGHAVQHAKAYAPLQLRSKLVPTVSFASKWVMWVLMAGMVLIALPIGKWLMLAGIVLYGLTALFSLVTLPVEVDASRRATNWLEEAGITNRENHSMAKSALHSAAYTYVVAALGSLGTLFYYVLIYMGRR